MTEPIATHDADLHCPLCEYNLRGLAEPRCPECGFAFSWDELRAAGRSQHPWLFEHGRRRNLRTLWTTWWWNRLPWAFWRAVSPTNLVRVGRLVAYWVIVSVMGIAMLAMPLPHGVVPEWAETQRRASGLVSYASGGRTVVVIAPSDRPLGWLFDEARGTWYTVEGEPRCPGFVVPAVLLVAWPWMSVAALLVFRRSMLQARINTAHVLRVAIYGCDFGWVVVAFAVAFVPVQSEYWRRSNGVPLLWLAVTCGALVTFRMTFAYGWYLRFHRPLLTVLASQVLVVLVVAIVLARTTNLSKLFR